MKPAHDGMKVSIMGREFVVACPVEEGEALSVAADYLDQRMREVQQSGRVVGLERCAVMAALNITHDLLSREQDSQVTQDTQQRLRLMSEKISTLMNIDGNADATAEDADAHQTDETTTGGNDGQGENTSQAAM